MKGKGKTKTPEEQQADKWLFPPQLERTKNDFLSLLDTMAGVVPECPADDHGRHGRWKIRICRSF